LDAKAHALGKEGRELMFFADFAKTDEFWQPASKLLNLVPSGREYDFYSEETQM